MSLQALKNLTSLPQAEKKPDSSNMFHMFNSNTYTDFIFWNISAYKHVLIVLLFKWFNGTKISQS